jgi:hypothetical protein
VVALALLAVVVTVTAAWVLSTSQATRLAHEDAQAADLLQADLEDARATPYPSMGMSAADLGGDPLVQPSAAGGPVALLGADRAQEPVATVAGAVVAPHVVTRTSAGTSYRVARYVTQPTGCSCRRYSAVATWSSAGRGHTRWASELVTDANRATVSDWSWAAAASGSPLTGTGNTVTVPLNLLNNGSRDSWSLTLTARNSSGSVVTPTTHWFRDDNADGSWQSGTDPNLDSTAAANVGASGTVESGRLLRVLAVVTVPTSGSWVVSATSTSTVQPGASRVATVQASVS